MKSILSPSIVCCNGTLEETAATVNHLGFERLHVDVTIGSSVHGLLHLETFGMAERVLFTASVDLHVFDFRTRWEYENLPLLRGDCMIVHLFPWVTQEVVMSFLQANLPVGVSKGLALDMHTSMEILLLSLSQIEAIAVMGIEVGGRGLPLNEVAIERLQRIGDEITGKSRLIIDGGVNVHTFRKLVSVAETIVIGGLLFNAPDLEAQWNYLQQWLKELSLHRS